jgi:hypothetical protein
MKPGPLGPDKFENDYAPDTPAERLAKYGKQRVAEQDAIIAKVKAYLDKAGPAGVPVRPMPLRMI